MTFWSLGFWKDGFWSDGFWGASQPASQPAIDGPWRKLTGEYPKRRKRREPAPLLEAISIPPLAAPAIALRQARAARAENAELRAEHAVVEMREALIGELLELHDSRGTGPARAEAELAIALLLAA